MQQDLVRRRALRPFLGELHVEVDLRSVRLLAAQRVQHDPDARARVKPDHELRRRRPAALGGREPEPRGVLEHQPQLGLLHGQSLSGADQERHSGPAPVVHLQA